MSNIEIKENINNIKKSPIRRYLQDKEGITIFEAERESLNSIDNIVDTNLINLNNPLKVVILGEVKAGKSTLVNALIQKKVSYTNVVEATATILEVSYAEEEKIVIERKNNDDLIIDSLMELDELMNINRENQGFFNEITRVKLSTNTERLKEITLVDTPGLNTVTSENEERTNNYIANADVIIWVLNSHHLGQSDVVERLEEILDYGKPIIGIVNRIDEISGDITQLIDYVDDEMGYMFDRIIATSGRMAWEGFIEKDTSKIEKSNIDELYSFIVNDIERNSNEVQLNSVNESIKLQLQRDIKIHKNAMIRLKGISDKVKSDLNDISEFNITEKKVLNNKIDEWLETQFLVDEKKILLNASSGEELERLVKQYISVEYIKNLINEEYKNLNEFLLEQWQNYRNDYLSRTIDTKDEIDAIITNSFNIDKDNTDSNNVYDGMTQGGVTAGAVGLGLAGYAAWLGPAASYVTIGSAVATFIPPLLIAGLIGGAVWKLTNSGSEKKNIYKQVEDIFARVKLDVKTSAIKDIKEQLQKVSDTYKEDSEKMVLSILNQCNCSIEELGDLCGKIDIYIKTNEIGN